MQLVSMGAVWSGVDARLKAEQDGGCGGPRRAIAADTPPSGIVGLSCGLLNAIVIS
ncbi:hypothetical protein GGE46_000332 [Rhizobium etli]|uniref:Uncharacterized protein n=1 Tax=Rhizobium etli TaxID=29449 RepID=A0A7W6ZCQ8_RHIET|nr:hypothetical protein [Rhizobium etli]MBB4533623.1 hypothetical protein [Rhizobium etli]